MMKKTVLWTAIILMAAVLLAGVARADVLEKSVKHTYKSLSAQNTYTDWVCLKGYFGLSVSGTWSGTLTIQRSYDGGTTPLDIQTYTDNTETMGLAVPQSIDVYYRVGFKTGDYTSGTAVIRIGN